MDQLLRLITHPLVDFVKVTKDRPLSHCFIHSISARIGDRELYCASASTTPMAEMETWKAEIYLEHSAASILKLLP